MKKQIFIASSVLLALVLSMPALAQTSDPQAVLDQADQFLGQPSFQKSFVQGTRYTQDFRECSTYFPCQKDMLTDYTVKAVSIDTQGTSTAVIAGVTTGIADSEMRVPEKKWDDWHGNMVRAVIDSISQSGFIATAIDGHLDHQNVEIDGQMKSVDVFKVHVIAKNQLGISLDETMAVSRELSGYAQLISWTEKQFSGAIYTRTMTKFSH